MNINDRVRISSGHMMGCLGNIIGKDLHGDVYFYTVKISQTSNFYGPETQLQLWSERTIPQRLTSYAGRIIRAVCGHD